MMKGDILKKTTTLINTMQPFPSSSASAAAVNQN